MSEHTSTHEELDQYLTFILNNEEYGVPILKVRGIQGWEETISIPNCPDYVMGIINLRGEVVPIIDLRKRFDLEMIPYGTHTVVIIVSVDDASQQAKTVGIVVDAVADVHDFKADEIRTPPGFGNTTNDEFVNGLGLNEDKLVILLEVDNIANWDNNSSVKTMMDPSNLEINSDSDNAERVFS